MCEKCVRVCNAIKELTSDEASEVTILSGNPEFYGPNNAIICNGLWTDSSDLRIEGDSLLQCLENAVIEKKKNS